MKLLKMFELWWKLLCDSEIGNLAKNCATVVLILLVFSNLYRCIQHIYHSLHVYSIRVFFYQILLRYSSCGTQITTKMVLIWLVLLRNKSIIRSAFITVIYWYSFYLVNFSIISWYFFLNTTLVLLSKYISNFLNTLTNSTFIASFFLFLGL